MSSTAAEAYTYAPVAVAQASWPVLAANEYTRPSVLPMYTRPKATAGVE